MRIITLDFTLFIAISAYITVVTGRERFLEEPQDSTVSQGQDHTLRCAVADRQGNLQWLRDGFGLGPGPKFDGFPRYEIINNIATGEYNLHISAIELEDDAIFECQVGATQYTSGLKSRRAKLAVLLPADEVMIVGGSRIDVIAGQENRLTCRARNGRPAPSIRWYAPLNKGFLDEREHSVSVEVVGQASGKREDTESILSLVPLKQDQGLELVCGAVNSAMSTPKIASVTLNVLFKPEVVMNSAADVNDAMMEGSSLFLSCSATGNPRDITWKGQARLVLPRKCQIMPYDRFVDTGYSSSQIAVIRHPAGRWQVNVILRTKWLRDGKEMSGETRSSLRIPRLGGAMDGSVVQCEATNSVGSTSVSRHISVNYGPEFLYEPPYPAASPGDDVTLSCEVASNPSVQIHWTRYGSSMVLGTGNVFNVSNVQAEHFSRGYTCSATGVTGTKVSRNVRILKRGPPRIISSTDQGASYGSLGMIECHVAGVPKPNKFIWSKGGKYLDIQSSNRHKTRDEDLQDGVKHILEISSVQPDDFSVYNCTAINEMGEASIEIQFSKRELVHIAYIISGAIIGFLIILAIIIIVFIRHRRKKGFAHSSGSSTMSSDDSIKKVGQPNLKIEFSTDTVDSWHQKNLLDSSYQQPSEYDELKHPSYRGFNTTPAPRANGYASSVDGYGYGSHEDPYYRPLSRQTLDNRPLSRQTLDNRPLSRQTMDNPYGTLPRGPASQGRIYGRLNSPSAPRSEAGHYGTASGSDIYATYGGRRPRYGYSSPEKPYSQPLQFERLPPPPLSPTDSKLSTNV